MRLRPRPPARRDWKFDVTPSAAIVMGLVLIVLGIPMIRSWVPRVQLDWLLLPGLSVTDEVWYESHRRSGWDLVLLGFGLIVLATWLQLAAGAPAGVRDFLGVSLIVALLIAAFRSVIVTFRLAREHDFTR